LARSFREGANGFFDLVSGGHRGKSSAPSLSSQSRTGSGFSCWKAESARAGLNRRLPLAAAGSHSRRALALVIGGFGLAVLALVATSLREAAAMRRWPVAQGRVLSAKVEEYQTSVSRGVGGARTRMTLSRAALV
jgi:hypothetical protein